MNRSSSCINAGPVIALALVLFTPLQARAAVAVDGTFNMVETYSVTFNYDNFANSYTGTKTFSGRTSGKVTIQNGTYSLVNKTGLQLAGLSSGLTERMMTEDAGTYSINGGHVFAPGYAAKAYGILFLGAFIVKVPLVDGEVPAFFSSESYAGSGPSTSVIGGGRMRGVSLTVTVSSTLSLAGGGGNPAANAFTEQAGNYAGLFYEADGIRRPSSGLLSTTLNPSGAFSARLTTRAGSAAFSGRFDAQGKATNQLNVGGATLTARLHVNQAGGNQITGQISGATWTADLIADRALFNAKSNPATDFAHRYTLVLPGTTNSEAEPSGDGFAAVTITTAGQATLKGVLADGTPVSWHAAVAADGSWPVFVSLTKGAEALMGWLHFDPAGDNAVAGRVTWSKEPGGKSRYYPNGFSVSSDVAGSIWSAGDGLGGADAFSLSLTGGNLPLPLHYDVTVTSQGKVVPAGPEKITLKLTPSTGLFTGTIQPGGTGPKLAVKGAVLQGQAYGAGFFLGTNQSGRFLIQ